MTDKHDEGIKEVCSHLCSTGIRFGRSKLLQSCSNFMLKPELEPTVIACLTGRDAQEVFYTGFVHTERRLQTYAILQCRYSQDRQQKHVPS